MKHFLRTILFILPSLAGAQELTSFIPGDATYVVALNYADLSAKSQGQDYTKFLKPLTRKAKSYRDNSCELLDLDDLFQNGSQYGLDPKEYLYIYRSMFQQPGGTVYLMRISDLKIFESKINTECSGAMGNLVQKRAFEGGYSYASPSQSICIRGNVAVVFSKDYKYSDYQIYGEDNSDGNYDSAYYAEMLVEERRIDSMFYMKLNKEKKLEYENEAESFLQKADTSIAYRAKQRSYARKMEKLTKQYNEIFELIEKLTMAQSGNKGTNRNFAKMSKEHHDAFVYMDAFYGLTGDLFNPSRSFERQPKFYMPPSNRKLTADLGTFYAVDFAQGKVTVNLLNSYSNALYPYMKKAYGVKQDKKLFKYIDGQQLLGYISVAANGKELGKFYEDLYTEMLSAIPLSKHEANIAPAIELFFAMLDKEMLFNTLNGRTIIACTGFADVHMKTITYDYNENFERTEKVEEIVQKQPRVVMASAIGNKENARKLFNIIGKFTVFTRESESVLVFSPDKHTPIKVYFILNEDALIITNDENLVSNYRNGYPSDKQMSSEEKKFIMKHNLACRIKSQQLLQGIQDNYISPERKSQTRRFSSWINTFGDLEIYDNKPEENSYSATAVMNLKDASGNSLYLLMKLMSKGMD